MDQSSLTSDGGTFWLTLYERQLWVALLPTVALVCDSHGRDVLCKYLSFQMRFSVGARQTDRQTDIS